MSPMEPSVIAGQKMGIWTTEANGAQRQRPRQARLSKTRPSHDGHSRGPSRVRSLPIAGCPRRVGSAHPVAPCPGQDGGVVVDPLAHLPNHLLRAEEAARRLLLLQHLVEQRRQPIFEEAVVLVRHEQVADPVQSLFPEIRPGEIEFSDMGGCEALDDILSMCFWEAATTLAQQVDKVPQAAAPSINAERSVGNEFDNFKK